MDRGFLTMEETALYLGRKVSTLEKWIYAGRLQYSIYLVHGGRVQRVVRAEEAKRLRDLEIPNDGERPDSLQQRLWNKRRAPGIKGSMVRARKRKERAAAKPKGAYVHHLGLDTSTPESMPGEPSTKPDEPKA